MTMSGTDFACSRYKMREFSNRHFKQDRERLEHVIINDVVALRVNLEFPWRGSRSF